MNNDHNPLLSTLKSHQEALAQCTLCPQMTGPPVHGLPTPSPVMLIGQAPGFKEIEVLKPFAWTAGKTLFSWFQTIGMDENRFRQHVYMSAICRCYPGKKVKHGDRVPNLQEISHCARWLNTEIALLKPELIILVGKLAINQFLCIKKLDEVVGQTRQVQHQDHCCHAIALPHPSGASTWPRTEPGKTLLRQAMMQIEAHPAWRSLMNHV